MENLDSVYIYDGPVMQFGRVIQDKWRRGTRAPSPKKALANLQFTYKIRKKMARDSRIELDPRYLQLEG